MYYHTTSMYCATDKMNIGHLYVERNAIDENPTYQRESAIWSPEKQQLFIDSLINNYDIPKLYFHDLRGQKQLKKYAIIDGKQRLHTVYEFLDGKISLANDFKANEDSEFESIKGGISFKQLSANDQERFKNISLSVVMIRNAGEDDIEELFFRLNNGEPLNGAEKRNARGGDMNAVIKEVANNPFFTKKLKFKNKRFSHYEIAAKFILLELGAMNHNEIFSDLKKKFLDSMVETKRTMNQAEKQGIISKVSTTLGILCKIFNDHDELLAKQAYPPLYYIFIKLIHAEYGHRSLFTLLREFLEDFQVKRQMDLQKPEEERDPYLTEFGRLMQQGTNDITSLKERVSILRRYFLLENPEVRLLDEKRAFAPEERYVIYVLSGKECAVCHKELKDIKEMEADHVDQYRFGGSTTLKNSRALCIDCNLQEKKNMK